MKTTIQELKKDMYSIEIKPNAIESFFCHPKVFKVAKDPTREYVINKSPVFIFENGSEVDPNIMLYYNILKYIKQKYLRTEKCK